MNNRGKNRIEMPAGMKVGRLTVLKRSDKRWNGFRGYIYECICDCGKTVHVAGAKLRHAKCELSCGCARQYDWVKTHGKSRTKTYTVWRCMLDRCRNSNNKDWKLYGGRGIQVCERWKRFENFYADMGDKPAGKSIDRIDNNRGYEPGNCRWATQSEQSGNRRNCRFLEYSGVTQNIAQWARALGVRPNMIRRRLGRGWSVAAALTV